MKLLDGKTLQKKLLLSLKEKYEKLDRKLTLVVFLIGNSESSLAYIKQKEKVANYLNCHFILKRFDSIREEDFIFLIEKMNQEELIDGIIIQLPLPESINKKNILNHVSPSKDIDGLHKENREKLSKGKECFIPCTPKAILDLLAYYHISIKQKKIVILGRSILVGQPLQILMEQMGGYVTLLHSKSKNQKEVLKDSDIVISAVGKPHLIQGHMLKKGVILLDVGTNYVNGKLLGDVDSSTLQSKCSYAAIVPGGVGPMTVYELFSNLYDAYKKRH